jgi:hypothetical protein
MKQYQSYKGRTDKRWLSQLLADAAFPVLLLAVAVSQVKIEPHKKEALRQRGPHSSEVRADDGLQQGAGKNRSRAASESAQVEQRTGSDKESAHND